MAVMMVATPLRKGGNDSLRARTGTTCTQRTLVYSPCLDLEAWKPDSKEDMVLGNNPLEGIAYGITSYSIESSTYLASP